MREKKNKPSSEKRRSVVDFRLCVRLPVSVDNIFINTGNSMATRGKRRRRVVFCVYIRFSADSFESFSLTKIVVRNLHPLPAFESQLSTPVHGRRIHIYICTRVPRNHTKRSSSRVVCDFCFRNTFREIRIVVFRDRVRAPGRRRAHTGSPRLRKQHLIKRISGGSVIYYVGRDEKKPKWKSKKIPNRWFTVNGV